MKGFNTLPRITVAGSILALFVGSSVARDVSPAPAAKPLNQVTTSRAVTGLPTTPAVSHAVTPTQMTNNHPTAAPVVTAAGLFGGVLLDENRNPAAGVTVTAKQLKVPQGQLPISLTTVTGPDGSFSFPSQASGLYAIRAVAGQTMAGADLIVKGNKPVTVHLVLQPFQPTNHGAAKN